MTPIILLSLLLPFAAGRKITIVNSCRQTVWPGIYANPGPMPNHETGWELKSGDSSQFEVDEHWQSGRVFARTGCILQDGQFQCLTGGCGQGGGGAGLGGSVLCPTTNQPATLAEFTLGDPDGNDHFDVSLVDGTSSAGFNVPMSITPSAEACKDKAPKCNVNLNTLCPPLLRAGFDTNGANMLCKSSCQAGFGDTPNGNRACCNGAYQADELCEPCGVDYYRAFKEQCPDAYAHAYDEKSETALWQCRSENKADYTIELCPGGTSFIGPTKASEQYADATATCEPKAPGGTMAVRPSPTSPAPSGQLKIALSDDGPAPTGGSSSGSGDSTTSRSTNSAEGGQSASAATAAPSSSSGSNGHPGASGGNAQSGDNGSGTNGAGGNGIHGGNPGSGGNGGNRGNGAPGDNGGGAVNLAASGDTAPSQTTSLSSAYISGLVSGPTPHVDAPGASRSTQSVNLAASGTSGGGRRQCPAKRKRRHRK